MRLWYLSHRQPAKAQASLRIHAVLPEPSLFAHMKYGSRQRVQPKIRHLAPLDLNNKFTEDKKYYNLLTWHNWVQLLESRTPFKSVVWGMRNVAFSSISQEQAQSNQDCCFPNMQVLCISKGSPFQNAKNLYYILVSNQFWSYLF